MRRESLILGLVLVVLVFVFYVYNSYSEGFEAITDKIQDRANTLAGQQNPLTNPAAQIGVSEAAGSKLRILSEVALNMPRAVSDGAGSYNQVMPTNLVSPRIDNENSFLGIVNMCKEKGKGNSPFSDSAFAENCGMCITSGTLITGESFTTPTGVVVYKADKDEANATKINNGYSFARAIPSLNGATCVGANKNNDALPVLAINQEDFDAFRKRKECRDSHKIGEQCGRCVSDQESTWVPPSGGKQPLTLYLWGAGKAAVSLANGFNSELLSLSSAATAVPIGRVEEGTGIQVSVSRAESVDGPYVYGVIVSATAAKGIYKLPMEKFMEKDSVSGAAPRRNGVKYFDDVKVFCNKLMPQSNQTSMSLQGFIPVTMVEYDQLAAFDCPSAPIVQTQASAELLIDDVCLSPKGQGPGTYSDDCIKQTILQAGCSTNGDWYKNPPANRNFKLGDYMNDIKKKAALVDTDPGASMGCLGVDISTPCDAYLNGGIPDKTCMTYLYLNQSETSKRVGRAYKYADTKYASMVGNMIGFCRPQGELNPQMSANAMGTLTGVASGYKGVSGIEAVKMYLSDVFTKAVGSLDVNVEDDKGGRKTSWKKCFGMKIADAPLATVSKNSINDVIDRRQHCVDMPKDFRPAANQKIMSNIKIPQNYVLSFNVTPNGTNPNWSNLIHFTNGTNDMNRLPAIWFWPGDLRLHVRIGDTSDWNWGIDTNAIPMNQTSSFRLECIDKKVTLTVNSQVFTLTQPTARKDSYWFLMNAMSPNNDVYSSFPGYSPANCYIQNMCYTPM